MNFDLTDDQARTRVVAREVARSAALPRAVETDRTGNWPVEIVAAMGAAGLLGTNVPIPYGGQGADAVSCGLAIEELSCGCASSGLILSVHSLLCCETLCRFATESQKRILLPALACGSFLGTSALTQSLADRDPCTVRARFGTAPDAFILDGSAARVVGAEYATWILVLARVPGGTPERGGEGPTVFVVPRSSGGVRVDPPESIVGARAAHVSTVHFDHCHAPASQVLGELGGGLAIAQAAGDAGRFAVTCQALGIARAAFEESVEFAREGERLGEARSEGQVVSLLLADMATEIDAARMLAWRAARAIASRSRAGAECSMAKVYATEMAARVTCRAAQMRGYGGFLANSSVERHGRDARVTEVFEGTSDIQRSMVASDLLTP